MFEPHADARKAAMDIRQQYMAFVQAGFSEDQALAMIQTMISVLMRHP